MLRLIDPVYDNGFVELANLPYPDQMLPHNFYCYITGWGLIGSEWIYTHYICINTFI